MCWYQPCWVLGGGGVHMLGSAVLGGGRRRGVGGKAQRREIEAYERMTGQGWVNVAEKEG